MVGDPITPLRGTSADSRSDAAWWTTQSDAGAEETVERGEEAEKTRNL